MTMDLARTETRKAAWAQSLAASPPLVELADVAAMAIAEGLDESAIRARVEDHAESIGLATWRFLFPGLNRKVLRYPFPKLLHALATYYAKGTRHKTLRDFVESFTAKMGLDDWIIGSAISVARTGEPLPVAGALFGGVTVQHMTFGGDDAVDVVMLVAGPASDFDALAREFLATCQQTYPNASLKRSPNELRDARWFRAFEEGTPDSEIAWDELIAKYPQEIVHENPKFAKEHARLVQTIKQARKRHFDQVTEILGIVSPGSETD